MKRSNKINFLFCINLRWIINILVLFLVVALGPECLKSLAYADYYSLEFGDMDANHDDFVNFDEYRYYISRASYEAFRKIDTNQDETIDFFEWVAHQEKQSPFESREEFRYKGKNGVWYMDRNGNRYMDRDEYYFRQQPDCRPNYWHGHWPNYWRHHWHDRRHRSHLSFGYTF
jgi:hypothetical protein